MIKQPLFILVLTAVLLLAACAAEENEQPSEPDPTSDNPALEPISPDQSTSAPKSSPDAYPGVGQEAKAPEAYPVQNEGLLKAEPYPGLLPTPESEVLSGVAYPVEVDLSQLTPQPPEENAPQLAPKPGVPDAQAAVAHQLIQELAQRLALDVSQVATVEVTEVSWSDSSLGCPAPGMAYLTVITPGYQVILEAAGDVYTYHTDLSGRFVLCGEEGLPVAD